MIPGPIVVITWKYLMSNKFVSFIIRYRLNIFTDMIDKAVKNEADKFLVCN